MSAQKKEDSTSTSCTLVPTLESASDHSVSCAQSCVLKLAAHSGTLSFSFTFTHADLALTLALALAHACASRVSVRVRVSRHISCDMFLDTFPAILATHFLRHISRTCFPRHVSRNICFSQHISRNMFSRNMFLTTHFLRHISCDVPVGIYDAGCVNVPVARTFTYPSPLRPPCLPVYSFTTPSH